MGKAKAKREIQLHYGYATVATAAAAAHDYLFMKKRPTIRSFQERLFTFH